MDRLRFHVSENLRSNSDVYCFEPGGGDIPSWVPLRWARSPWLRPSGYDTSAQRQVLLGKPGNLYSQPARKEDRATSRANSASSLGRVDIFRSTRHVLWCDHQGDLSDVYSRHDCD